MGRAADVKSNMERLGRELPGVMGAFAQLHQAGIEDNALSAKAKRLVMVGISLSQRCEACLRVHVQAALELGATRAELLDVAGVAILMGGGPVAATAAAVVPDLLDELGG